MNYLVYLDMGAGELEKILSGVKTMVLKRVDPTLPAEPLVGSGDSLYFLRNNDECVVRVKATVVRVLLSPQEAEEGLSHFLKELQPRLQLTEDQYNYWSEKRQALFVEFKAAQKIPEFRISVGRATERTGWIRFEEIREIIEEGGKHGTRKKFTG